MAIVPVSSRAAAGLAGGDLTGSYPDPTLGAIVAAAGPTGSASVAPIITIDAKGRVTAMSSATITPGVATGGAMTRIDDKLLAADAASFDFTSIPATYISLLLVTYLRNARSATSESVQMTLNAVGTASYYDQAGTLSAANTTAAEDLGAASLFTGRCPGDTATALRFGAQHIWLPNYANTTNHKSWVADSVSPQGTGTGSINRHTTGGVAAITAAVSRITLVGGTGTDWRTGSRATLYGIG